MNALPGPDGRPPLVGIVGHAGAYGRWLARFLERRMGLQVRGSDIADPGSPTPAELARQVDVLVFSVPIRRTVAVIESCIAHADGGEAGALWLDLTSIKQAPVAAMLGSRADVAGLHPMAAPPNSFVKDPSQYGGQVNHIPGGGNVLYMDGHVEFVRLYAEPGSKDYMLTENGVNYAYF